MKPFITRVQELYRRHPLALVLGTAVGFVVLLPILMPLLVLSVLAAVPFGVGVAMGWHWRGHPEKVRPFLEWRDRVATEALRMARQTLNAIEQLIMTLRARLGSGQDLRKT